ncbi:ubiquinone/menaquinone biosynthesis C-methylase UbiE [Sporosarcina luteola]|nr:ubiquinone/menaquinone biosynthesis C-methylase UbiE [Sporosarcina luteola]
MIPIVYDQLNRWGKDDDFFLSLLQKLNIKQLADLGCGTGRLTVHFAQQGYEVTAIDPNKEAIEAAKSKEDAGRIKWMVGDSVALETNAYDAVIMTANVAQVFLTEESWQQVLADAYRALKDGGHLIFDTRNPLAQAWIAWMQDDTPDAAVHPDNGDPLEIWTTYEGLEDDIFTFYETVKNAQTEEVVAREKIQLKFRTLEVIRESLQEAGFSEVRAYGDWEVHKATTRSKSFIFECMK